MSLPPPIEPVGAEEYAATERRFAELLGTAEDLFIMQGEPILALEAAARSLGRPGLRVLNVVVGPYGPVLGGWLADAGSEVRELAAAKGRCVDLEDFAGALEASPVDLVAVVHAEAATGAVNPLAEMARLAHGAGALVLVDAVASVGAEPLDTTEIDLVVTSAQKALDGPSGAGALVVGDAAWTAIESNPHAPRRSALSLLDWWQRWVRTDRSRLPVIAHHLEMRALDAALARALEEGLDSIVGRHRRARDACRAGLAALGLEPVVAAADEAASVATLVHAPGGIAPAELVAAAAEASRPRPPLISVAPYELGERAVRVDHTGRHANVADVASSLVSLGLGLHWLGREADLTAALEAALGR